MAIVPLKRHVETRFCIRELAYILGGSLFLGLISQIAIYTPTNPVPFTLQAAAVVMLGATLGARCGFFCLVAYLLEGASGIPVFAHGASGAYHLFGPTSGYLLGFVISAYIAGYLSDKEYMKSPVATFISLMSALIPVYLLGYIVLSQFIGYSNAWTLGVVPFIWQDPFKMLFLGLPFLKTIQTLLNQSK